MYLWRYKRIYLSPKSLSLYLKNKNCGTQPLQWPLTIPIAWYSMSCVISSPWGWPGPSDSLAVNRMGCKQWDVTSNTDSKRLYFSLTCSFFHSNEVSCHLVNWPKERSMWKEVRRSLTTTSPTTGEALTSTVVWVPESC